MAWRGLGRISGPRTGNLRADGGEQQVGAQTSLFMCIFLHLVAMAGTAAYSKAQPGS